MDFANRNQLIERLRSVWNEGDELRLSVSILEMIETQPSLLHIPYSHLQRLAKKLEMKDPAVVQRVVEYLTGAESHVLELCAELIEEDDTVHALTQDDLQLAMNSGVNPLTGLQDSTLQDCIFVFFSPSQMARQVLWR